MKHIVIQTNVSVELSLCYFLHFYHKSQPNEVLLVVSL